MKPQGRLSGGWGYVVTNMLMEVALSEARNWSQGGSGKAWKRWGSGWGRINWNWIRTRQRYYWWVQTWLWKCKVCSLGVLLDPALPTGQTDGSSCQESMCSASFGGTPNAMLPGQQRPGHSGIKPSTWDCPWKGRRSYNYLACPILILKALHCPPPPEKKILCV